MSSFDPLAAIVADAALAQSSVAAIDLGVQIEILQQQLTVGDLITATILPPQNGVDLLSLLGQTVQAQLPPGIDPGQTLLLQVTGFQGNQILVRNIGVVDPENPPPTVTVTLPPPEPGAPAQATLYTIAQPNAQAAPAPPPANVANSQPPVAPVQQPPAAATSPPVAPPRAVFVAASVQRVQASSAQQPPAPSATPQKNVPIVVPPETELGLEARIAATRAASIDIAELVNQPAPAKPAPAQSAPAPAQSVPARALQSLPPPVSPPIAPRATPAAAIAPELALLARLRIPALPFTLAAARLANNAASILPKTLARLDAVLASIPQDDPRAATIRTIAAFLDKIDLSNTRALPEQLMAYVSNVVDGAESKLAALVRGLDPDPPAPAQAPEEPAAAQAPLSPNEPPNAGAPSAPANALSQSAPAVQPNVAAHAAERAVALQYDLKAAIVSMTDAPPRGSTPQLQATLGEALTTITAVQLGAANAQNTDPNAIVIPLPVFYYEGGRPAQLRIARDAPQGGKRLDADNFHIAFVLDTKSLGTVAVDVQTASRSVSVNVKTEVQAAASRFRDTFDDLRGRLEQLQYRVATIAANVAPSLGVKASETSDVEGQSQSSSRLDLQA